MNAVVDALPRTVSLPQDHRSVKDRERRDSPDRVEAARDPFTGDPLRGSRWRSFGLAAILEILIALGLVTWFVSARLATPASQRSKTLAVRMSATPVPPRLPRPRIPPVPTSASTPVQPSIEPLTPITNGIPVPRALTIPAPPAPALEASSTSSTARGANAVDPYALYSDLLRERVKDTLVVPAVARELGLRGRTLVEFRLTPSGRLLWVRVLRSSGMRILDQAALLAVRRARFPRFLSRMRPIDTTFELAIHLHA